MLIRPDRDDLRMIGFTTGRVVYGVGVVILVPTLVALALREWNDATAMAIGAMLAILLGQYTTVRLRSPQELEWSHGMVTVALSWLLAPLAFAVPLYLTGHFGSFVDAYFDAMSGLTTSGLSVMQDLDHIGVGVNLLRHITHFAGGQGIVIVVLTVFASGGGQIGTLYVGEGRDERVVPNIIRTARFIYLIATAWLLAGTAALTLAGVLAGLTPWRALHHGINIFMAAFDTGGFSPNSTSIAYYHSATYELVVTVLMIAGTLSFPVHYQLWRRQTRATTQHLETRTLALTTGLITLLALVGLVTAGTYADATSLTRKGAFTIVSAHTGTGFTVVAPGIYVSDWGLFAPAAVVFAMALGGMAGSTAGGIKAIRIGLAGKSVLRDIRKAIAPMSSLVIASYRSRTRRVVRDEQVRAAIVIIVLFLLTYLGGALVGVFYGYRFDQALFESTSAAANVGLSIGIVGPVTPTPLKLTYIAQMYLGRLEFMAAFALLGYGVALVRGRV
ncbi:MAG: TrkH family potassium uptake protein [Actinomycetes bacterium]